MSFKTAYQIALDEEMKRFDKIDNATASLKESIYRFDDTTPAREALSTQNIWRCIKEGADLSQLDKADMLEGFDRRAGADVGRLKLANKGFQQFEHLLLEQRVFTSIYKNDLNQVNELDQDSSIIKSHTQDSAPDRPSLSIAEAAVISSEIHQDSKLLSELIGKGVNFSEFEKVFTRDTSNAMGMAIAFGQQTAFEKMLFKKPESITARHMRMLRLLVDHQEVTPLTGKQTEMLQYGEDHLKTQWEKGMVNNQVKFFQKAIQNRSYEAIDFAAKKGVYPGEETFLQLELYLENPALSKMAKLDIDNVYQSCCDASLKQGVITNDTGLIKSALLKGADPEAYRKDSLERTLFSSQIMSSESLQSQQTAHEGLNNYDRIIKECEAQLSLPTMIRQGDIGELTKALDGGAEYTKATLREVIKINDTPRANEVMEALIKDRLSLNRKEADSVLGKQDPTRYESKMYRMITQGKVPQLQDGSLDHGFVTQAESGFSGRDMDKVVNNAFDKGLITEDQQQKWGQLIDATEDFLEFKHEEDIKWGMTMTPDYAPDKPNSSTLKM